MITFNNEENPQDEVVKNLKKLLDELSHLDFSDHDHLNPEQYDNVNISDITQIIYDKIYQQNSTAISLLITKNENNSLELTLDIIE